MQASASARYRQRNPLRALLFKKISRAKRYKMPKKDRDKFVAKYRRLLDNVPLQICAKCRTGMRGCECTHPHWVTK